MDHQMFEFGLWTELENRTVGLQEETKAVKRFHRGAERMVGPATLELEQDYLVCITAFHTHSEPKNWYISHISYKGYVLHFQ